MARTSPPPVDGPMPPDATPSRRRDGRLWVLLAGAVALVLVVAMVVVLVVGRSKPASNAEVLLEPSQSVGSNPVYPVGVDASATEHE
jgi:hypothetical protein